MNTIKLDEDVGKWLNGLQDIVLKAAILQRLSALKEKGLVGDSQVVTGGSGLRELRIHVSAGARLYYIKDGANIFVFLQGGLKGSQKSDIKKAKEKLAEYEEQKAEQRRKQKEKEKEEKSKLAKASKRKK